MLYYTKTIEDTLKELNTSENGLSGGEIDDRVKKYGLNVIKIKGEPLWKKIVAPFKNIFMAVLAVAVIVSLFEHAYLDAAIIGLIMVANAVIYYVQRFSTERILRSLQEHHKQMVEVVRGKKITSIESSQLVPGDIIMLNEGEKIPADARLIKVSSLRVDEAQLTGESEPITKQTHHLAEGKEVYERTNMLFQGSFLVSGEAMAVVTTTGNHTEFGKLAGLAGQVTVKSPVQHKIDKLLSQVIIIILFVAAFAFVLSLLRGISVSESIKFVIALAVSSVPESLPVAISVVLVLAMRRMATKKALVRGMSAIETIGAITTIATDKTGTLTQNVLKIQETWTPQWAAGKMTHVLALAVNRRQEKTYDPLDIAFSTYVADQGIASFKGDPMTVYPFDTLIAMSGNLWHHGSNYELAVKGSPEAILSRSDITEVEREEAEQKLHALTSEGYRVIAIAHRTLKAPLEKLHDLPQKDTFSFTGFVAIADALRPEAKKAVESALSAGVTVRMITGDHFETAFHIGQKLGMVTNREQVFDSRRMHNMDDEELEEVVNNTLIFSRVIPENKYRILTILKKRNITAMTGDGVNDVPALSNADVGIAMGSGSHIAKDAGDIILLDDNFKSIIDAMHEGRTVTGNVRRMIYYLFATTSGGALTFISALIAGIPLPLAPIQILWVNLVTDTCMVIPLGLEPGKEVNMLEKPRSVSSSILSRFMISRLALVAVLMASLTLGFYIFYSNKYGHDYGRTIAFNVLVVLQWASAFTARSDYQSLFSRMKVLNGKFYVGLGVAVSLQMAALFTPLGSVLYVSQVNVTDLIFTSCVAIVSLVLLTEVHKLIGRRYYQKGSQRFLDKSTPVVIQ